jgi:hypothetical protein
MYFRNVLYYDFALAKIGWEVIVNFSELGIYNFLLATRRAKCSKEQS